MELPATNGLGGCARLRHHMARKGQPCGIKANLCRAVGVGRRCRRDVARWVGESPEPFAFQELRLQPTQQLLNAETQRTQRRSSRSASFAQRVVIFCVEPLGTPVCAWRNEPLASSCGIPSVSSQKIPARCERCQPLRLSSASPRPLRLCGEAVQRSSNSARAPSFHARSCFTEPTNVVSTTGTELERSAI